MQQVTIVSRQSDTRPFFRPFQIMAVVASIGQYVWWLASVWIVYNYPSLPDPNLPLKTVVGSALWIVHLALLWNAPRLANRGILPLLYVLAQGALSFGIGQATNPYSLGFAFHITLSGQILLIFQNYPLALLSFLLSLIGKEANFYLYLQATYVNLPQLIEQRDRQMLSALWSDILFLLVNLPYGAALYLQLRARKRTESLLNELDTAHRELTSYAAQVKELTLITERTRLARELHDTLAAGLTGVSLQLEALDAYIEQGNHGKSRQIIDQMKQRTRNALANSRTAIKDLRAAPASEKPLVISIQEHVEQFSASSGIPCTLELPMMATLPPDTLPEETVAHILRCLTECLTNVERHAAASSITLRVEQTETAFDLHISDNGAGFVLEDGFNKKGHYGLLGLRERARLVGGEIDIHSIPGKGTQVHLHIDVPHDAGELPPSPSAARLATLSTGG
jgi:signal transduction histidine kinase